MSFENKGSFGPTVTVSREPDRSGNFVCDGTADDVQIQAALDYVNVLGGGTIYIKQGTYTLQDSGTLLIYSDTRLTGDGSSTVLRSPTNVGSFRGMIENANFRVAGPVIDRNIEIDHIQWDGRQVSQTFSAAGIISMENVENIHIHHNFFRDGKGYAVLFQAVGAASTAPCRRLFLYNNYCENFEYNFVGTSDSHATFINEEILIAFNEVTDTDTAISVWGHTRHVSIIGNYCYDNKNVGQFVNSASIAIEGGPSGFFPEQVTIIGNVVHDSRLGIGTVGTFAYRGIIISNNVLYDCFATIGEGYPSDYGVAIQFSNESIDCVASNNIVFTGAKGFPIISLGDRCSITDNVFYGGIDSQGRAMNFGGDFCILQGNLWYNYPPLGVEFEGNTYAVATGNIMVGGTAFIRGFDIDDSDNCYISGNLFYNIDVPINLDANSNNNLVQRNRFYACGFPLVTDSGTGNMFDSEFKQFQEGTTFISATGSAKGWEIDANAEYAIALIQLPPDLQQIIRIDIWAVALVTEADAMRLEINMNSGADNEPYTSEAVAIPDHPSETTNFAANDVIFWRTDSGDDSDIGDMRGAESLEIQVLHEAAGGDDVETDAVFRVIEIQYV